MATISSEYHIPETPETRQETTLFEGGNQIDLHKSKLERIDEAMTNALGAATQTAATIEGTPAPAPIEHLSPSEEVLQFGRQTIQLRRAELDANLFADNPYRPTYLDNSESRDDFTRAA